MDVFQDPYVILARKVTTFFGFWPFVSYKKRFFPTCIISFSLIYALLTQLYQLLTLDFNLRSIIVTLQLFLPFLSVANIYCTSLLSMGTVKKLISWVAEDWLELNDEIEVKIMQKHMNETKLFPKLWGGMFCIYISSCMVLSLLSMISSKDKVVDNMDRYPISSSFSYFLNLGYYHYFIVLYQIFTVVVMTMIGITNYSGYIWYTQHTCARFSIVKNKLHRPFINHDPNGEVSAIPNDRSYWMIDIIQYLTRTVQFVALANKLSENCYMFQVSMAFLLLVLSVLCLFQIPSLLKDKNNLNDVFTYLLFAIATFIPTYINCFIGQRVIDYSTDVYREISLVPIHELSLNTQKLLLITLMMNAKPSAISIGKIFVASHEFFSDILRTSVSFAMLLHSTEEI